MKIQFCNIVGENLYCFCTYIWQHSKRMDQQNIILLCRYLNPFSILIFYDLHGVVVVESIFYIPYSRVNNMSRSMKSAGYMMRLFHKRIFMMMTGLILAGGLYVPASGQNMPRNNPGLRNLDQSNEKGKQGAETTPYDKELFRLSELLGALGYLHPLCSGIGADEWSQKMQLLVEAEGKDNVKRKDRITGAYNKGFRNYALVYYKCTPNAHHVIKAYSIEAEKLSKRLSSRYGG